MQLASMLWRIGHRHYEEMCVLAVTGQLGGPQMHELNAHVARCRSCRSLLESMAQLSAQVMPLLAETRSPSVDANPPEGMRERFLARLASAELEKPALRYAAHHVPSRVTAQLPWKRNLSESKSARPKQAKTEASRLSLLGRAAAFAAVCVIVGLVAFYVGKRQRVRSPDRTLGSERGGTPVLRVQAVTHETGRSNLLEHQKSALLVELATVREYLRQSEKERRALSSELADTRARLVALTAQAQNASQRSASEIRTANSQIGALSSRVDFLNQRLTNSALSTEAQQRTTDQLTAKLRATEAELQRENEWKSAKLELGDLAAARNLHIVDVYDADSTGKRRQSFGRVFYVEGKSLVFYAYDLNDRRPFKANVVFHVWGGKSGRDEVTHSLGILRQDSGGENLWTLTFDDPTVLAQINSVFVTEEAADKHYDQPHGRKILFAFLGSQPNHP